MKTFKLLLIVFGTALMLSSCEGECDKTEFEEIIVGTWGTPELMHYEVGEVTFNSDGTGTSTESSIFSAESYGNITNDFTWFYSKSFKRIVVYWEFDAPLIDKGTIMDIAAFDCDVITLNLFRDFTLTKK